MAKQLRHGQTHAEALLWDELRGRRLDGLKFRRQQPLGPYVVDFYCIEHRLIVEVDGDVHEQQQEYDLARTEYLEAHDTTVIRFSNEDVLSRMPTVLDRIRATNATLRPPSPAHGRRAGDEGFPATEFDLARNAGSR